MAQIDTGMGWNAKDTYMMFSPGEIGQLTDPPHWDIAGYTMQQVPVTQPIAIDVVNNGLDMATWTYNRASYHQYVAANKPGVLVAKFYSGVNNSPAKTIYYLPDNSYQVYMQETENTYYYPLAVLTNPQSTQVSGNTVYYYYQQLSGWRWDTGSLTINVPTFPYNSTITGCVADGYPHIVPGSSTPIYKDNEGYSVGCSALWLTQNGVKITTPVLISSESSYTDMSCDSPGYNLAKLNILYKGIPFRMAFFDIVEKAISSNLPLVDLTGLGTLSLEQVFKLIAQETYANIQVTDVPDPYDEPPSEEGGGDGEEDGEDPVDFTDPPSTAIGATGFLTIFTPSLGQLRNLATFMWNTFDVDNWRRLFANPMDAILGLHIIPVPPSVTGTKTVKVAGISTEIEMDYTTVRYIRRSMGTCAVPKKWGAYLDYNPYTKVSIFLPYIGFKDIDADDIMGETIALQYMVDILTGACVAELKCGDTVLYSWQGNCANEVPITGSDWRGAIASALGIAGSVAATALTGGASAPMIAGTIASVGANSLNLKPSVNRSGAIAGSAGFMGAQRPYIIRTVPNLVIPADQNKFIGYPSFVNASLGSLTGYNEISAIHLEGIPATGNELSEIETLLKGGVIF